jgi:hypothetical protein
MFMKLLTSLVLIDSSLSELDPDHLKGIDSLVSHPGANPLLGYIALKSFLPNRRFIGHYGPQARGFFCTHPDDSRMGENLLLRHDCPQDSTSEWLQRLFPSQDGSNFVANQLKSDPVSRLTPYIVGQLLERVAVGETDWSIMVEDLTRILHSSLNPIGFVTYEAEKIRQSASNTGGLMSWIVDNREKLPRWIIETHMPSICQWGIKKESKDPLVKRLVRKLPDRVSDFCELARGTLDDESLSALFTEIQILAPLQNPPWDISNLQSPTDLKVHFENNIPKWLRELMRTTGRVRELRNGDRDELTDLLMAYGTLLVEDRVNGERNTFHGTYADFREIAELFVNALKESRGAMPVADGFVYPPYFPEQTLLAYMLRRIDTKEDLLPYFLAMPALVRDKKLLTSKASQEAFVEDTWQINPAGASEIESLVHDYVTRVVMTRVLPPQVPQGQASHSLPGMRVGYPDCGETSLRNFFNSMLLNLNTRLFDASILDRLDTGNPSLKIDIFGPLKQFYLRNHYPSGSVADKLRHEWAFEVVSRHEGIKYNRRWETLDGKELLQYPPQFDLASDGGSGNMFKLLGRLLFAEEDRLNWEGMPRESQVSTLCRLFSRPGLILKCEWEKHTPVPGKRMQVLETVSFHINGHAASMDWEFYNGHYAIIPRTKSEISSLSRDYTFVTAPLFFSGISDLPTGIVSVFDRDPFMGIHIVLSGNYEGTQSRCKLLDQILSNSVYDDAVQFSKYMLPIAKRLMDLLQETGDETLVSALEDRLIRASFPFGTPEKFGPDKTGFRRVEDSEFRDRFPILTHLVNREKFYHLIPSLPYLPIKWETRVMGQTLITFDNLGDENAVSWTSAFFRCLSLNGDPGEVDRVRHLFELREAELQKVRGQSPVPEITPEIEEVYRRFPLNGVALLGYEQFLAMREKSLRILPKPQRYFWSGLRDVAVMLTPGFMSPFKKDSNMRTGIRCVYSGSDV